MDRSTRQYSAHNESRICTCYSCLTFRTKVGAPIHTDTHKLATLVDWAKAHPLPY